MNMLFIGGLLVLGLLGLVGAIFLSLGEKNSAPSQPAATASTQPSAENVRKTTRPLGENTEKAAELPVTEQPPLVPDAEVLPALNGQLQELTTELRSLHSQARDLEQRLSTLTTLLARIEYPSPGESVHSEDTARVEEAVPSR